MLIGKTFISCLYYFFSLEYNSENALKNSFHSFHVQLSIPATTEGHVYNQFLTQLCNMFALEKPAMFSEYFPDFCLDPYIFIRQMRLQMVSESRFIIII